MSPKRQLSPPITKETLARLWPGKVTYGVTQELSSTVETLPPNVLILPAPALLKERQEADALIKQLTDTLPLRLDDDTAMGQASEHLIITRKLRKMFEEMLKYLKKPIKQAIDDLANDYNPYIVRLQETENKLNWLLSDYRAEATRKQAIEDQQIADEHRELMNEARAQGVNPLSIPMPLPAVAPPTGFQTAHGKTTTMRVAKWKCIDPSQVPYEYNGLKLWLLNDAGIGALRRSAGVEAASPIPGIEYFFSETPVVR